MPSVHRGKPVPAGMLSAHARFDGRGHSPKASTASDARLHHGGLSSSVTRAQLLDVPPGTADPTRAQLLARNEALEARMAELTALNEALAYSTGLETLQAENWRLSLEVARLRASKSTLGEAAVESKQLDTIVASAAAAFVDTPAAGGAAPSARWTAARWLSALSPEREVAGALLKRLHQRAPDERIERGFLLELAAKGSEAMVRGMLREGEVVEALAHKVWAALMRLHAERPTALDRASLVPRATVVTDCLVPVEARAAAYGSIEVALGPPPPDPSDRMRQEHCDAADAELPFIPSGGGEPTTSMLEYWYVVDPQGGLVRLGRRAWPAGRAMPQSASSFERLREVVNGKLRAAAELELEMRDLVAARLYTGPLACKYDAALRALHEPTASGALATAASAGRAAAAASSAASGPASAVWHSLCRGNSYRCTLLQLNAAIVKLSKLTPPRPLFCVSSGLLPIELFQSAAAAADIALDTATAAAKSTTTARAAIVAAGVLSGVVNKGDALAHARSGGSDRVALQLQPGIVSRAADLGWLASPPVAARLVFPPLTPFEPSGEALPSA